ncbi:MAG: HAD-IIB family hydrolase [Leucobacter sp.]
MQVEKLPQSKRHLIALDLDGTVIDNEYEVREAGGVGSGFEIPQGHSVVGHIDPKLHDAIGKLYAAGHEVVVSTGRSVDATLPVVEALGIRPEWVVCANGAVTLKRDPLAERAYRREYVEAFDPTDALKRIRTHLVSAHFAVELAEGGFLYTEKIPGGSLPDKQKKVTFDELLGVQATRVVVVSPDHHLQDFLKIAGSMGLNNVTYSVGYSTWLDIAPLGVTKASALEVIAGRLQIDRSRVFAAGDGRNDLDMLSWAAAFGDAVAMGQAVEDVKAVASRTTRPVEENGLWHALRDRFPDLLMS